MKYKAGDKVRVRKDLVVGKRYGCYPAVSKMVEKSGKSQRFVLFIVISMKFTRTCIVGQTKCLNQ